MNNDTLPPIQAVELEDVLIGALLTDPSAIGRVSPLIKAGDFFGGSNRSVFEAIQALVASGMDVDLMTVAAELSRRGVDVGNDGEALSYLVGCIQLCPTSTSAETYAKRIAEAASDRRLAAAARMINNLAYGNDGSAADKLARAQALLLGMAGQLNDGNMVNAQVLANNHLDTMDDVQNGRHIASISTGLADLDRLLSGGLYSPFCYYIGGRPGMGKSALALGMAIAACSAGKRVAVFSLEMSGHQVANRVLSSLSGIPVSDLGQAKMAGREISYHAAVDTMSRWALTVDDRPAVSAGYVLSQCQRLAAGGQPPDLVIVDHLHLMTDDRRADREVAAYGNISADLAAVAKTLGCAMVVLAQLNRTIEARGNKRPTMADFRESGRIEENAYAMMGLYRDDYYNAELSQCPNVAEAVVIKNRDGQLGTARLFWNGPLTTFCNLSESPVALGRS